MSFKILTVSIQNEQDVVLARQRARELAALLGLERGDQTRLATAVSEIARNAYQYGGGGKAEFSLEGGAAPQLFLIRISDAGAGIANLEEVLAGRRRSGNGLGLGISGARRLVDQFEIRSSRSGTAVVLKKMLPPGSSLLRPERLMAMADELIRGRPADPYQEIQQQNQELLAALDELRQRQEELALLNSELEDTNRGVVALYAELDEKADHLRRADEIKSRFLSNMSHEFRTPLNSITALTGLLLGRSDGDLTPEQEKQVSLIRKGAQDLTELVNDLLDLAKVEAGKIVIRPAEFEVANLFGALRGMLRPLLINENLKLIFEEPQGIPPVYSDEGKVSQILRNFISNALKYTERGEVRVAAAFDAEKQVVTFRVSDTGIGIAREDQERIFQEFSQLDHPIQKKVKGTGLGLPLSRRLAELLGGSLRVESRPGVGSTFHAAIPVLYQPVEPMTPAAAVTLDESRLPVLVVEDNPETAFIYEKFLKGAPFQMLPARTVREAHSVMKAVRPSAIVLDILLPGEDAWVFLAELKSDPNTSWIPVLVVTGVDDRRKVMALGADAYCIKPVERRWLVDQLTVFTNPDRRRILIVDDDEASRYLLRRALPGRLVIEAGGGREGLRLAVERQPQVIFLDLKLPDLSGFEVLEKLKEDPQTRDIPVIVVTSRVLEPQESRRLAAFAEAILSKQDLSPEAVSHALATPRREEGSREAEGEQHD